jgi:O-antigen/teichoic acid export membrane protein
MSSQSDISKNNNRTSSVKRSIVSTFMVRGLSVAINLLMVPVTLSYLNNTRYGIWMTLTSVVAWMTMFDVGLANGLRNKLAEALAIKDYKAAKKYVSTSYAMLTILVAIILLLFYAANYWIDWTAILNTNKSYYNELNQLVLIVITLFGIKFVLATISIIATADQKPALGSLFDVIGNAIALLLILLLIYTGKSSLISFGWVMMLTPVIIYVVVSIVLFSTKYKFLRPGFSSIEMKYAKDLIGLGLQFFIIQIAVVVIFQTGNILISQFFSPAEVTPYNIIFKYYSMLTMVWGIVMAPLWSAFTHALAQKDYKWIENTVKKLNIMMLPTFVIVIVMAFAAPYVIKLWTGDKVKVLPLMSWVFAVYTIISIWNNIYAYFLNGISKNRIQIITSVVASIINIPLAIFFIRYMHMGSEGIVLAMALSLMIFSLAGPIQSWSIIRAWKK